MQINNSFKTPQQSFGMAVKVDKLAADGLAKSLKSIKDWVEFDQVIRRQANNNVADIFVKPGVIAGDQGKYIIEVGARKIKTGLFKSVLNAIKQGEKIADDLRLRTEELALDKSSSPYQDVVDKVTKIDLEPVKDVLYKGVINSPEAIKRFNKIANMANVDDMPEVNVFTNLSKKVSATVGSKEFKQGIFDSTLVPLEKAVKKADEIRVKENALEIETNPNFKEVIMGKVIQQ